jgi:glycosidase
MRPKWLSPTYSTDKTVVPVEAQLLDSKSLLIRYKELLQVRKSVRALIVGSFQSSALNSKQLLAYYRIYNNQQCLVLHNITATKKSVTITDKEKPFSTVAYQTAKNITMEGDKINLPPYSSVILLKPIVSPITK